jgi:predicted DNA-binding transcriptional regulator YafY
MASRPSEPRHFRQVSQGTLMGRRLQLRYYNRTRNDFTDREISPQRLVYYRGNWYLDAWCHLRNDLRSFAVDAMQKVSMTPTAAKKLKRRASTRIWVPDTASFPAQPINPQFCALSRPPRVGYQRNASMQNRVIG